MFSRSARATSPTFLLALVALFSGLLAPGAAAETPVVGTISTLAGTGFAGYNGDLGPATAAQLNYPSGVAVDSAGNVYIADPYSHRVRRVDPATGVITTVAGTGLAGFSGDTGAATAARLNYPSGVAVSATGDLLIADRYNHRIRRVTAGVITTVAGSVAGFGGDGGVATAAQLHYPFAVTVDAAGNLFIADTYNHRIRKVTAGTISTVAGNGSPGYNGDGMATGASLSYPDGVGVDAAGNIYIADQNNNRIRKVNTAGIISTVAGTGAAGFTGEAGPATAARIYQPAGLAVDAAGNVYFGDFYNDRIRKITVATGLITTVAGTNGPAHGGDGGEATAAQLNKPIAVAVDAAGGLYIADYYNHRVRRVTPPRPTLLLSTIAGTGATPYNGDGPATGATLYTPRGVAVDAAGNVYIADTSHDRIRKVTVATGMISTIAGTGIGGFNGDGAATSVRINSPAGLALDGSGNLYFADSFNYRVRRVTPGGDLTTVAGNGTAGNQGDGGAATTAQLRRVTAVAVDTAGNLYIADPDNNRIRKVTAATNVITTYAGTGFAGVGGDGGSAASAQLNQPSGVAVDTLGNVYIGDTNNHRIRKVTPAGIISTFAGTGAAGFTGEAGPATAAQLRYPLGVAVDAAGSVYIADQYNQRIRKVSAATGVITTVAGSGDWDFGGDGGAATAGQLQYPDAVTVDAAGSLYIADTNNHRVRKAEAPRIPPVLTARRSDDNTVTLTWTAAPGAERYTVKRGATPGGETDFTTVTTPLGFTDYWAPVGTMYYYVVAAVFGTTELLSNEVNIGRGKTPGDFDRDGRADLVVYRPSTGSWFVKKSSDGYTSSATYQWGWSTDIAVPGDYDGDGITDYGLYRPSTGYWWVLLSGSNFSTSLARQWGFASDVPAPGDYDGDGKTDLGLYRPSTGVWYVLLSSTNYTTYNWHQWGFSSDIVVTDDYDGDGKTDLGLYRPSSGVWYILLSKTNYTTSIERQWGFSSDIEVTGDYDGDGKADLGVYRPSSGYWFILQSSSNFTTYLVTQWGIAGDVPLPADYDGDGKADLAVYRPSTGQWYILLSTTGYATVQRWGEIGDVPVPIRGTRTR